MIKVRRWEKMLIAMILVPVLERLADALEKGATTTEAEWDDILASSFRMVVEVLKAPGTIEET
ncbi:MAG TPA: hypothetical protein PKM59_12195 [Thermodesulfobacteriota bacterium]|nr:hypothetical protein [Thermodesulfobacteriota bacterium]